METPFLQLMSLTLVLAGLLDQASAVESEGESRKLPQPQDTFISYPLEGLPRQPRTDSKHLSINAKNKNTQRNKNKLRLSQAKLSTRQDLVFRAILQLM